MSEIPKKAKKTKSPQSTEDWAKSVEHLRWPLIAILIFIFLVVVLISITTPDQ